MNREKLFAVAAIVAVTLLLFIGNGILIYYGNKTWPGQTTDTWTGRAPQP